MTGKTVTIEVAYQLFSRARPAKGLKIVVTDTAEHKVITSRVESNEHQAVKPDLRSDNLLKEGAAIFARNSDKQPSPVTADGKQIEFTNIWAQQHGVKLPGENAAAAGQNGASGAEKTVQDKAATLFSKDATDEQKLATVKELAKSGIKDLNYRDASGADHKLRMELESAAGGKEMVHLFAAGADGRERTALRGVSRADGSFEHEQDKKGNAVDFHGKGYSALMSDQPNSPTNPDQRGLKPNRPEGTPDRHEGTPNRHEGTPNRRDGNPDRPEATPNRPDGSPDRPEGMPNRPEGSGTDKQRRMSPLPDAPIGTVDRSQFDDQLKNPKVMAAFAGRMASEVGTQGPAAQVAFAEEVMNRAAARNQTLMQALTGSYYPTHNPGRSNNPEHIAAITHAWQEGSDTTHGATGNASGRVGFGVRGGHYDENHHWVSPNQTAHIGGERFGHEQVDLNRGWLDKYMQLRQAGSIASRDRASGSRNENLI